MKTIVVYFSLEGNVDALAQKIAQKLQADTFRLETVKEYPKSGLAKFFHGGRDAALGFKPELKPIDVDFEKYEHIILGTPVWAGKPSAPLNSFLSGINLEGKDVSFFTSCSGGSSDRCVAILERTIKKKKGRLIARMSFVNPLKNESSSAYLVDEFCKKINSYATA